MIGAMWSIGGIINDDTISIAGHGQLSTRAELLEFRMMLVTIRGRIKDQIDQGRSVDQVVASNPARGYAEPGDGTTGWVRAAYEEYR